MAKSKKTHKPLRHTWLEETDPANAKRLYRHGLPGFWVPTPSEIEFQCELARESFITTALASRGGVDERRFQRPPKQVTLSDQREMLEEESQLCDCPYWGTEFKDLLET